MRTIALFGAGGKMGQRLAANLLADDRYVVRCVEPAQTGRDALMRNHSVECMPEADALKGAEVVILAVPDSAIGKVSHKIAPLLEPGAMLVLLDAAAPFAGELPDREDLTYFIAHPCHPPMFNDETEFAAKRDYFGGVAAKQNIVCSLMQGPEHAYAVGEEVARSFYGPVMKVHRATVEQMAILEPVLSETITATCLTLMREGIDEAVLRGVPWDMARDFVVGHIFIEAAIIFEELKGVRMSDACLRAIDDAKRTIIHPDWRQVFEPEQIKKSIEYITSPA
ncbi:MAG: phosphogluconate dehydrogenase C-terminal domain-containing protein [Rhizobiaceae bacterium]